jgi:hypothetical protein
MSDFYSDMRNVASDLLGEFNQGSIQYIAVTAGSGTPDDPGAVVETVTDVNGVARGVKFSYIDNSLVVSTDLQVTIPADVVTPSITGFVRIDGLRYKIVKIIPKPAAGAPVACTLIVRK